LDRLPLLLMHTENDIDHWDAILRLRSIGLADSVGISIDSMAFANRALELEGVEAIQVPMNMLDRRFRGAFLKIAREKGVRIFTRSAFLQGLLAMPVDRITMGHLRPVLPIRCRLEEIAKLHGLAMPELCLRYVLGCQGVDSVLFGVDSVEQLTENLAIFADGSLPGEIVVEIDEVVPEFPETILRPFLWLRT
ncbi:MAG: aldo/keto reductase, partial [Victivallales bacterium]|nr:aldo/keto reductase [Victivallales bacterium]